MSLRNKARFLFEYEQNNNNQVFVKQIIMLMNHLKVKVNAKCGQ